MILERASSQQLLLRKETMSAGYSPPLAVFSSNEWQLMNTSESGSLLTPFYSAWWLSGRWEAGEGNRRRKGHSGGAVTPCPSLALRWEPLKFQQIKERVVAKRRRVHCNRLGSCIFQVRAGMLVQAWSTGVWKRQLHIFCFFLHHIASDELCFVSQNYVFFCLSPPATGIWSRRICC